MGRERRAKSWWERGSSCAVGYREGDTEARDMNVLIVSVENHTTQMLEAQTDTPHLRARKLALKELLESQLAEGKTPVILEEWSRLGMTIAHQLACRNEPAILWRNIDMNDDERRAAGIFDEQNDRPQRPVFSEGPMPEMIWDRVPSDCIREDFFVSRILETANGDGRVLVLLGNGHVAPVAKKLRATGHTVSIQP